MTDITIPPEALRAARAASMNARGDGDDPIRAACLAMLRAWPGTDYQPGAMVTKTWRDPGKIILPLPQEPEA